MPADPTGPFLYTPFPPAGSPATASCSFPRLLPRNAIHFSGRSSKGNTILLLPVSSCSPPNSKLTPGNGPLMWLSITFRQFCSVLKRQPAL